MEQKECINKYRTLQDYSFLDMPCPRCGKQRMRTVLAENALSRHETIYVCPDCGTEEALEDYAGRRKPLAEWYAVKLFRSENNPNIRVEPDKREPYYMVPILTSVKVTDEDIDDIMCSALEGGICYWCDRAEVAGDYLGEYAHEQISRGGTLLLHDREGEAAVRLTLEKFMYGLRRFLSGNLAKVVFKGRIDPGEIDGARADSIIQYAVFDEIIYG